MSDMNTNDKCGDVVSNPDKVLGTRCLQIWAAITFSIWMPSTAHAGGFSDWIVNIGKEFAAATPVIIGILAALGIMLAGFGVVSAIMAKKNQRPLEYQMWFVVGGVVLVLLIPFVSAVGESLSGQDAGAAVESVL